MRDVHDADRQFRAGQAGQFDGLVDAQRRMLAPVRRAENLLGHQAPLSVMARPESPIVIEGRL